MKYILLFFITIPLPAFLSAAIIHDNSSTAKVIEKKHLMWNHTTNPGTDRILVIGITNGSEKSVSAVTYNGIDLTEGDQVLRNSMRTSLWYLVAPDEGTHKVKITLSVKADIFAGADTYSGVDQSAPWGSFVTASGKSTSASATLNSATGQLVVDVIGLIAANPTNNSDQNLKHKVGGALYNASSSKPGASSVSMTWTHIEGDWGMIAAPLVPTSILPVDLLFFSANAYRQTQVELVWASASEINNDYFTIERSKDALYWEEMIAVESKGNGTHTLQYKEFDAKPYGGTSYYRLKQTDFDGSFQYSESVAVEVIRPATKIVAYPNPIAQGNEITVSVNLPIDMESVQVAIINASGMVEESILWDNLAAGYSTITIPTYNLSAGMHQVRISSPTFIKPIFTNMMVLRIE